MNLQQHLEIQASAQQWADDFMNNYSVSATEMVDALTKVLLNLKDKVIVEYLTEITQQQMQLTNEDILNNNTQFEDMEIAPQEEEVDNGRRINDTSYDN